MKTAVEWLFEKFMTENTTKEGWHEIFEQAKEMEKVQDLQQWIETWSLGYNSGWDNCIKKFKQQDNETGR